MGIRYNHSLTPVRTAIKGVNQVITRFTPFFIPCL